MSVIANKRKKRRSAGQKEREWFLERLADVTLVDRGIAVHADDKCIGFAVPVNGTSRRGGYISCASIRWAKQVYMQLAGKTGFPSVRIDYSPFRDACHTVEWGEQPPDTDDTRENGRFYGYREDVLI